MLEICLKEFYSLPLFYALRVNLLNYYFMKKSNWWVTRKLFSEISWSRNEGNKDRN